jgi:signal peptidase II
VGPSKEPFVFLPLIVGLVLLILDQITKAVIVAITNNQFPFLIASYLNDFLQIRHDRNLGIAFSGLNNLEGPVRVVVLIVFPILFLGWIGYIYFREKQIDLLQRWGLGLILSGGIGNIIDRIFRSEGVVDFISVRIYGFLGMERWPTFNVADATLVVGGGLIVISMIKSSLDRKKAK